MNPGPRAVTAKHLFLMRHASAGPGADDRARPLTPAGRREAAQIAHALAARSVRPAWALVSPARRAQETLDAIRGVVELAGAETDGALYLASSSVLRSRLERVPEQTTSLLVIGHNPGLSELLHELVASGKAGGLAAGAVAVLRFAGRWGELSRAPAHRVEVLSPD